MSNQDSKRAVNIQYPEICNFLIGSWKRSLRWKHFGGVFGDLRTTNTMVLVEEYKSSEEDKNSRYLKWSFGKSMSSSDMRFGYVMRFDFSNPEIARIEWQYNGHPCTGTYQANTSAVVLHFQLKQSTVVITYRIVDQNTLAVCIVEVDSQHTPTVQIGNMVRVNPEYYQQTNK